MGQLRPWRRPYGINRWNMIQIPITWIKIPINLWNIIPSSLILLHVINHWYDPFTFNNSQLDETRISMLTLTEVFVTAELKDPREALWPYPQGMVNCQQISMATTTSRWPSHVPMIGGWQSWALRQTGARGLTVPVVTETLYHKSHTLESSGRASVFFTSNVSITTIWTGKVYNFML